jgi:hypothetical protein
MTTDLSDDDIRERIDIASIDYAAAYASGHLDDHGVAIVHLVPGDATVYQIVVVAPQAYLLGDEVREGREYLVTLVNCSGATYPWNAQGDVHPSYAAAKWTTDGLRWTGVVLAAFLNALAGYLGDQ